LLAPIPGALVFRSDVERKALFDVAENDRLPPEAYQAEVSEKIYRILNDKTARVARAGSSVVVDAVFAKPEERAGIETVAADVGAGFRGLFLTADLQTRVDRIGTRGPDASDADAKVARQQEEFKTGAISWNIVDASGSPEETLDEARAAIDHHT
jgi:predicted kinase